MTTDPIISAIVEFRTLVKIQAERTLAKERELAKRPETAARVAYMSRVLSQRQRDHRSLIRATEVMERQYLTGKPWKATHRRIESMNKSLVARSMKIDMFLLSGRKMAAKAA